MVNDGWLEVLNDEADEEEHEDPSLHCCGAPVS